MTTRDRMVVLVVLTLAVLAGGWLFVVSPRRDKAAKLASQVSNAEAQLASAESQLNAASAAQAGYQHAYASLVRLGKAVPASQEVPSLIYQLAEASNHKNVEFASVTTGAGGSSPAAVGASPAAAGFSQMPFTFVFTGNFTDLYHLFQQLNEFAVQTSSGNVRVSGRLLTIQGIQLAPITSTSGSSSSTASSQQLTGTVTATAYVLPSGQTVTGGATSAGPAGTPTQTSSTASSTSTPSPATVLKGAP
jgi:Tfp pilus assembly protein PilO